MTWTLARLTLRECLRRPFVYVAATALVLVVGASRLFLAFTFGRERAESLNLVISAAFLAGFAVAALVGTGLIRRDLERKTLPWLLSMPLSAPQYVAGRLAGLIGTSIIAAALVTAGAAPLLAWGTHDLGYADVFAASARAIAPILVVNGAALAASVVASRIAAPVLLLGLFLAGALTTGGPLPEFSLFSLDANATAPGPLALVYGVVFCSIFAILAYIVLAIRLPAQRQN